jgi:phosphate transport system substrate-binding protein
LKNRKLIKWATLAIAGLLVLSFALVGCEGEGETTTISMVGSTTVQPVAEDLADEYMTNVDTTVTITVAGGGSSVGVSTVGDGGCDIGMASRAIKASEFESYPTLEVFPIAADGIAIVTDADTAVNVTCMTIIEVARIYAGDITNWAELGGVNATINVHMRDAASGTRGAFEEMVMEEYYGEDPIVYVGGALEWNSNGLVKENVAATPYSIGYLSFGFLLAEPFTVTGFEIDAEGGDGCIAPTLANALDGSYPIVRPLNLCTLGVPTGEVKEFIDWILTPAGQAIVAESYIPVGPTS